MAKNKIVVTGGPWANKKVPLPYSGTFKFRVFTPPSEILGPKGVGCVLAKNWCGYYNAEGFWIDCGTLLAPKEQQNA